MKSLAQEILVSTAAGLVGMAWDASTRRTSGLTQKELSKLPWG